MGEAKRRGTFEHRKSLAVERKAATPAGPARDADAARRGAGRQAGAHMLATMMIAASMGVDPRG